MKKKALHALLVSASMLSSILVFGVVSNWHGNSIQIAPIAEGKKGDISSVSTSKTQALGTTASSSSSNTIQLSVKEQSEGVYRWISSNGRTVNPTLKVSANTNNIIKIQNPTDTKHELIIDTGADVLPSRDDTIIFQTNHDISLCVSSIYDERNNTSCIWLITLFKTN
jgi:hypothetical protein